MTPRRQPAGERVFGLALRLFPRWFRERYGADMLANFRARRDALRRDRGRWSAARFALRAILEVPAAALSVRRAGRAPAQGGHRRGAGSSSSPDVPWWDDIGLAWKSLVRSPAWTGTALLILTLGLGGTAAVFSVLHAVLLRPLPYHEADRLVSLWTVNQAQDLPDGSSWENARDWLDRSHSLTDLTLVFRPEFTNATVSSFGTPERIHVGLVSANFFQLLGVAPVAGRLFGVSDLDADARVAVVSEGLWAEHFGRERAAVGSTLTLDGEEVRIVGVAPDALAFPREETRMWRLMDTRPTDGRDRRGSDAYMVVARMKAGATVDGVRAELDRIAAELAVEYPATNRGRGVSVVSLRREIVGDQLPLLLWTLFGSMVLVLLIGGTNVAQLMLGRGVERRREMAIRAALGATRARVNRQLLLESAILSVLAGLGGLLLAHLALAALVPLIPPEVPLTDGVRVDAVVLLTGLAIAAVSAPLVGLLPALAASRAHTADTLRAAGRGATAGDRRLRSTLVVAELALAVVLLAGAGLLLRSASLLQAVDPGFDAHHTMVARIDLSAGPAELPHLHDAILAGVQTLPDVVGAGVIGRFFIGRIPDQTISIVGDPAREPGVHAPRLTTDQVYPGFFEGLDVPLLHGRGLQAADIGAGASIPGGVGPSVVVNRAWVETFAAGRDPIGLRFRWGDQVEGDGLTVVGVVGDIRRTRLDEAAYPNMYVAGAGPSLDLLVRTRRDPFAVVDGVRAVVRRADPHAAVSEVSTAWERYGVGLAPRRFQTLLFGLFAALATLLATIGLYAILHDAVASRRREMGIRIALGAAPRQVRGMVVRHGLGLALTGVALGLTLTVAASSVMGRFVYGIGGSDPLTLGAVTVLLLAVAAIASALPARRATRALPAETFAGE